jgi:NitT/TauT family transport system permease protein
MLERSSATEGLPQADGKAEARQVAFRGAGFTPMAGRASGWIALALAIGSIRCSCRRRPRLRLRSTSSR